MSGLKKNEPELLAFLVTELVDRPSEWRNTLDIVEGRKGDVGRLGRLGAMKADAEGMLSAEFILIADSVRDFLVRREVDIKVLSELAIQGRHAGWPMSELSAPLAEAIISKLWAEAAPLFSERQIIGDMREITEGRALRPKRPYGKTGRLKAIKDGNDDKR